MRILFFNSLHQDYLSDSVLIGLKSLSHLDVVEYPGNNYIYENAMFVKPKNTFYGNAFSLYNLIDKKYQKKTTEHPFDYSKFDIFIFSNIHDQFGFFLQMLPHLTFKNTIIMDGADSPAIYPYHGYFWRRPYYWFLPRAHKRFQYFKREWTADTTFYRWYRLLPRWICKRIPAPKNLRITSFSIPEEKVIKTLPIKTKLFPRHIVDEEICSQVAGSASKYAFASEQEYYADLQASKFGITTKRAGWDCMRHYEIAANGSVICFKDLDKKPVNCAPHGLIPGVNCLNYHNYSDLLCQINALSEENYRTLQKQSIKWIGENTCKMRVSSLFSSIS